VVARGAKEKAVQVITSAPTVGYGAAPIAYLINQYPKVSHSFIRREILALERKGTVVHRIAIRGADAELVDPEDLSERTRTRYVVQHSLLSAIGEIARRFASNPRRFAAATLEAIRMARHSAQSLPYHLAYLSHACRVLKWTRAAGVEHLHAHFGTNSAEVAMLVCMLGGPSYSFTVHGPDEFDRSLSLGLDRKIGRAKFVVAVNSYCRAQLFRRARAADWGKIKIVHCGLESEFYDVAATEASADQRFVCVGRLCEQKGQLLLLDAFAALAKRFEKCRLVLAGDGEMRKDIEDRAEQLGITDIVSITGWISGSRVREEILAARALVLPSFQESLPVVIMEAMALRRPVISTYVAGIPELVEPGKTGWLVPTGSVRDLVEALTACLSAADEDLHRMGEAARARVIERHNVDHEVVKLARMFADPSVSSTIEEWQS
jgi:glycosyltransferase involved in cell wall biosynthesis